MVVKFKVTQDPSVTSFQASEAFFQRSERFLRRKMLEREIQKARPLAAFAMARADIGSELVPALHCVDIINLQFAWGFADYPSLMQLLPADIPVVVTMHGLENFTGGCSYTAGCEGFQQQCGDCPQLATRGPGDLSSKEWKYRRGAFSLRQPGNLHFVADSQWMAGEARRSSLLKEFPVSVIYYGIDTGIFRPLNRPAARDALAIPSGAQVVGFAADSVSDERKGIRYLISALQSLQQKPFLLTWGRDRAAELDGFPGLHLGHLESEHLSALVYNACDVFVMPSVEEAFGQTALEAQACGTPVVAFAAGGIPEVVRQRETGLLAKVRDIEELRGHIVKLLGEPSLRNSLGQKGVVHAGERFSFRINAENYIRLYSELLAENRKP